LKKLLILKFFISGKVCQGGECGATDISYPGTPDGTIKLVQMFKEEKLAQLISATGTPARV
jgi:hypothetical protein